jgi:hypothetical protein
MMLSTVKPVGTTSQGSAPAGSLMVNSNSEIQSDVISVTERV